MQTHNLRALFLVLIGLWAGTGQIVWAGPSITITPWPVAVSPGKSVQLKAEVEGPSEYRVKWILQGPIMENVDAGTLTEGGLYTAPESIPVGPVRIVAQVSIGEWNLPVAAASVPVQVMPAAAPPPSVMPPPPVPPPPFPAPEQPHPPGYTQ